MVDILDLLAEFNVRGVHRFEAVEVIVQGAVPTLELCYNCGIWGRKLSESLECVC